MAMEKFEDNKVIMGSEQIKIIAFSNRDYIPITHIWYKQLIRLGYEPNIVATDEETFRYFENIDYRVEKGCEWSLEDGLNKLWKCRLETILKELKRGTNIVLSDVDTIWREYIDFSRFKDYDLVHGIGMEFPFDVYRAQGWNATMGIGLWRATAFTLNVAQNLVQQCGEMCDDQKVLNQYYYSTKVKWEDGVGDYYKVSKHVAIWNTELVSRNRDEIKCKAWIDAPVSRKTKVGKRATLLKSYRECNKGNEQEIFFRTKELAEIDPCKEVFADLGVSAMRWSGYQFEVKRDLEGARKTLRYAKWATKKGGRDWKKGGGMILEQAIGKISNQEDEYEEMYLQNCNLMKVHAAYHNFVISSVRRSSYQFEMMGDIEGAKKSLGFAKWIYKRYETHQKNLIQKMEQLIGEEVKERNAFECGDRFHGHGYHGLGRGAYNFTDQIMRPKEGLIPDVECGEIICKYFKEWRKVYGSRWENYQFDVRMLRNVIEQEREKATSLSCGEEICREEEEEEEEVGAVMHIRLGDVTNEGCWENQDLCRRDSKGNPYQFGKEYYTKLDWTGVKDITLVSSIKWNLGSSKAVERSKLYRKKVKEFLIDKGMKVNSREEQEIDDDIFFMTKAKIFVVGGGGFSRLIGAIIKDGGEKRQVIGEW
eukprot:g831.t1